MLPTVLQLYNDNACHLSIRSEYILYNYVGTYLQKYLLIIYRYIYTPILNSAIPYNNFIKKERKKKN